MGWWQLLLATQTTLHGMLFSVFDASAECDGTGLLNNCSPHLCQLLNGKDLSATELWELGSTAAESDRLRTFVRHAVENAVQRAVTIQSSLRGVVDIIDVKLFAILLPTREGSKSQQLFLGVQTLEQGAKSGGQHIHDSTDPLDLWPLHGAMKHSPHRLSTISFKS